MVRAKKYVLIKHFQGEPKESDFKIVEEELPPLKDGEYLAEAEYLSVDPYMRVYMTRFSIPADMIGGQIAKITESKNPNFPVGGRVSGSFGWRTHTVVNPNAEKKGELPSILLPDFGTFSPSLGIGALGMPGNTAYFGLTELCKPKAGETVVVTGAAGAVGAHVGQIAKILGCKVIGFAGSEKKCEYLRKELGFDHAFNYRTVDVRAALQEAAPGGVDCYFDNVGGEISSIILNSMNPFGRVAVCGSISGYNSDSRNPPKAPIVQPAIVMKQLRIEGFLVMRWTDRWLEGIQTNLGWLRDGRLKVHEQFWYGFDNMIEAFIGMLRGENTGKAVVKV